MKFTVSTCLFISYNRLVFKYPKFKLHFCMRVMILHVIVIRVVVGLV